MTQKLRSILLIDDDEPTNYLTQAIIEDAACTKTVKAVQSGQEALEYLLNASGDDDGHAVPDLIFLDVNMPAMNGWEFLEKYRLLNSEKRGKVMIVMLTTSLFPEDRQKAMEIPEVSGFENKPLTTQKLNRILDKFFHPEAAPAPAQ